MFVVAAWFITNDKLLGDFTYFLLPSSQIISHSKKLGELKYIKFDQIYIITK